MLLEIWLAWHRVLHHHDRDYDRDYDGDDSHDDYGGGGDAHADGRSDWILQGSWSELQN